MTMADEIVLRVENIVTGATGAPTGGAPADGSVPVVESAAKSKNGRFGSFGAGVSAQMFVESGTRILSATGNQELASGISKASGYTFLVGRIAASGGADIGAIISLTTKLTADVIELVQENRKKKMEEAANANALDVLRMRTGAFNITGSTVISTNKFGRKTFADRK